MMDQDEPNHPLEDRLSVLTVKDPPSLMQTCQRSYYGLGERMRTLVRVGISPLLSKSALVSPTDSNVLI